VDLSWDKLVIDRDKQLNMVVLFQLATKRSDQLRNVDSHGKFRDSDS
jgi:hypothetical protein